MGVIEDMGFGGTTPGKPRKASYVVVITANGTAKLDKPGVPELQWRILNHLQENGPCPVSDLARELVTDEKRIKSICSRMEHDTYIMRKFGTGAG